MVDLKELAETVYENKVNKHFNVTDIAKEICYIHGEVSEIWEAYDHHKNTVGEEMADVMIYLLGLSRILNVDLEEEVLRKIEKNRRRVYRLVDGVVTRMENTEEEET